MADVFVPFAIAVAKRGKWRWLTTAGEVAASTLRGVGVGDHAAADACGYGH